MRPEHALIGTWQVIEIWDRPSADQPKEYAFGEQPLGYFVYDRTGHVHIQIAKTPLLGTLSKDELSRAPAEEVHATLRSYIAYFGTYTVDATRSLVTHHVEADVRRDFTGTDQERPFRFVDDELWIGDGETWLRRLRRVEE